MLRAAAFSIALFFTILLASAPVDAKSVKEFESMSASGQASYLSDFVEHMTADIGRSNSDLAQNIRDYFTIKHAGKPVSDGVERVFVEITALDRTAKTGKADLSNIQIESIVVWVVKQKFPPPAQ